MSAPDFTEEVCLIDDDASVLRSMRNLLIADGLKVRPFNKPEEFLAHAAKNPVAVVITDIWMEGMNGLEILARMCALNPRPQVIVITGREDLAARATDEALYRSAHQDVCSSDLADRPHRFLYQTI